MFPPLTILPRTDVHQHLWPSELPAATVPMQEGADRAGGLAAQGVDRALLRANPARLLG